MSKKILVVLSEWGYWGEELVGPLEAFEEAGYTVDFMTPTGKRPVAIGVSMDPDYVDPPLGRSVTSKEMGEKVAAYDTGDKSSVLDNPLNLSELMPERPVPQRGQLPPQGRGLLQGARREGEGASSTSTTRC